MLVALPLITRKSSGAALVGAFALLALGACGDPDPDGASASSTVQTGATGGVTTSGGAGATAGAGGDLTSGGAAGQGGAATSGGVGGSFAASGHSTSGGAGGSDSGRGGTASGGTRAEAGGGSGSGGAPIEASFETLKFVIANIQPSCAAADCHGGNEHNPLNLTLDDELYMRLTTTVSEDCGQVPVMTPGEPEQSALVMLLQGSCGDTPRMPAGCFENEVENNCVPDEYVTAIEQWISDGAPKE